MRGGERGMIEQSKQGTAFLYTVVVRLPWRTAVVITLTSKSEFIDYKEPAASLWMINQFYRLSEFNSSRTFLKSQLIVTYTACYWWALITVDTPHSLPGCAFSYRISLRATGWVTCPVSQLSSDISIFFKWRSSLAVCSSQNIGRGCWKFSFEMALLKQHRLSF